MYRERERLRLLLPANIVLYAVPVYEVTTVSGLSERLDLDRLPVTVPDQHSALAIQFASPDLQFWADSRGTGWSRRFPRSRRGPGPDAQLVISRGIHNPCQVQPQLQLGRLRPLAGKINGSTPYSICIIEQPFFIATLALGYLPTRYGFMIGDHGNVPPSYCPQLHPTRHARIIHGCPWTASSKAESHSTQLYPLPPCEAQM